MKATDSDLKGTAKKQLELDIKLPFRGAFNSISFLKKECWRKLQRKFAPAFGYDSINIQ